MGSAMFKAVVGVEVEAKEVEEAEVVNPCRRRTNNNCSAFNTLVLFMYHSVHPTGKKMRAKEGNVANDIEPGSVYLVLIQFQLRTIPQYFLRGVHGTCTG